MKHHNISPAPKSPQALDDKILSYAREHTPKKQSYQSWYGYAATACAFTIAAIMLPQLLQQAELAPTSASTSPIAKKSPAAAPPSSQPVMMQEMEEALDAANDQAASQSRRTIMAEDMARQAMKKESKAKDQTQLAMKKSSKAKRARAEQKQLSEVMAAAARYEPQAAPQQLESLESQLRQLQQAEKENPTKANSDYQELRKKCDCGLPESLSQAIDLLDDHKALSRK